MELIDYGDDEEPKDLRFEQASAIDGGEDADAADLRDEQAIDGGEGADEADLSAGQTVTTHATSSSATPGVKPGESDDVPRISASGDPSSPRGPALQADPEHLLTHKLKSVVVRPARALTLSLAAPPRRKTVWRRLDPSPAAALSSKMP